MAFTWDSLSDQFQTSLNERIDNEIVGDSGIAPQNASGDGLNINTANDETGTNKPAGTGAQLIKGLDNKVTYGGIIILSGVIAWLALK